MTGYEPTHCVRIINRGYASFVDAWSLNEALGIIESEAHVLRKKGHNLEQRRDGHNGWPVYRSDNMELRIMLKW